MTAPDALPAARGQKKRGENPFRRFEIIAFGSLPISLFYTNFGFDLWRYAQNGGDLAYAPWPFSSSQAASISDSERIWRVLVASGASLVVAGIDALLRSLQDRAAERREAAHTATMPQAPAASSPGSSPGSSSPAPALPQGSPGGPQAGTGPSATP